MTDLKEVTDRLDINAGTFYKLAGTTQQKLSYAKNHNVEAYENFILAGVCRYYELDAIKIIDLIESIKKIKESV